MLAMHKEHGATRVFHAAPLPAARELAQEASLTALILGLGGQGVVGLTRLLTQALQWRFARTASVETRGIAQRRAPVRAMVRAGAEIRSAASPEALVNLVVVLEASEVLRAAQVLQPGCHCLLSDLSLPPSVGGQQALAPAELRRRLEACGVRVITLQMQQWLADHRGADALASAIACGALATQLQLPVERCKALLLGSQAGKTRDDTDAAFRWGVAQLSRPSPLTLVPAPDTRTFEPCCPAVAEPA